MNGARNPTPVERAEPVAIPSNDEFDAALEQVSAIVRKDRLRSSRWRGVFAGKQRTPQALFRALRH